MYPYAQSIGADGARMSTDAYQQYYQQQRQQPERAYPTSTQAQTQPQAQPQQNATSPYYQGQFAPYYYQVPVTNPDGTAVSGQDRYQTPGLYQTYGQGYNHPNTAGSNTQAAAAPNTARAATTTTRPATTYPYAPYTGDMAMMSMLYPQTQNPTAQAHNVAGQPQAASSQAQSPVQIPHGGAIPPPMSQPSNEPPRGYATRGHYPPGAIPQSQIVQNANPGMRRTTSPLTSQRATINTHVSAIPVGMPITDPTGQTPPPGIKPRVTTTLWEDEGTTCFQVDARGFCVARREDNDMINGTKLLNVAGMTRGRRDGLLKGERNRHVVKAGAMHLKGVWIPYDRALDFANKERIVDLLYPLFVHDIKAVLYHPGTNAPDARPRPMENNAPMPGHERQQVPVLNGQGHPAPQVQSQVPQQPSMSAQPQTVPVQSMQQQHQMQSQASQQIPQQLQFQQIQAQAQAQAQAQTQTQQNPIQSLPQENAQLHHSQQGGSGQSQQIPMQHPSQLQQNQQQGQLKSEVQDNIPENPTAPNENNQSIPSMHLPEMPQPVSNGYQSQPIQHVESLRQTSDNPNETENSHSLGPLDSVNNQYDSNAKQSEDQKKHSENTNQHKPPQHSVQNENYNYEAARLNSAESNPVFYSQMEYKA